MSRENPDERYVRSTILIFLTLAMVAAGSATLIHWLSPHRQWMDLIIPPTMFLVFAGLIAALIRRPQWVIGITWTALLSGGLALAAPSWFYTLEAALTPGLHLVSIFPPTPTMFLVFIAMVIFLSPGRIGMRVVLLCWCVIALPVLGYLFLHPHEIGTPRGKSMVMAFGPAAFMIMVLLPMRRALARRINRLTLEQGQMETMVNRDPLTKIYNRRLAEQVLKDIFAARKSAGVILFDMDRFKLINDTYGHPAGDQVLQWVASRCKECLREYECIARWGGEEFMVIIQDVDDFVLQRVAERLRSAIAESFVEPVGQITASFGVALVQGEDNLGSLLRRVDQALYQSKKQGGNSVVFAQAGTGEP